MSTSGEYTHHQPKMPRSWANTKPGHIGETALLFGATGATGKNILRELLASSHFTRVIEAGRRVTAADVVSNLPGKEKLVQKTIDFENLSAAGLDAEKVDVVVIVVSRH